MKLTPSRSAAWDANTRGRERVVDCGGASQSRVESGREQADPLTSSHRQRRRCVAHIVGKPRQRRFAATDAGNTDGTRAAAEVAANPYL